MQSFRVSVCYRDNSCYVNAVYTTNNLRGDNPSCYKIVNIRSIARCSCYFVTRSFRQIYYVLYIVLRIMENSENS